MSVPALSPLAEKPLHRPQVPQVQGVPGPRGPHRQVLQRPALEVLMRQAAAGPLIPPRPALVRRPLRGRVVRAHQAPEPGAGLPRRVEAVRVGLPAPRPPGRR